MKSIRSLSLLAVLSLCGCNATAPAEGPVRETMRPPPPVRTAGDPRPSTPDLRGRPSVATGSACKIDYRVIDSRSGQAVRFTLVRGTSSLELTSADQTWFFERNPVHFEEVTGFRVDPARHLLIQYPFTDLAIEGLARDWTSLARLGIEPGELRDLHPTGSTVEAFGVSFAELRDDSASETDIRRVLWSEQHQIPLRIERPDGWQLEVDGLLMTEPSTVRRTAREAYPDFIVQDVADWREAVHDHPPAAHGH